LLTQRYGIILIRDVPVSDIEATARRLQTAFHGDPWGRILSLEDARVAATAFLKREWLATGDLRFYRRALDLGIPVGTTRAAATAAGYRPRPVIMPPTS
jgi:hypothetical protein